MCKNVVNELIKNGFSPLTAICTRPGDGRLTITTTLANELAVRGEAVCFCTFSHGNMLKKHIPLPCVQVLSPTSDGLEWFYDQLHEVLKANTFLFVDNLTAMVLTEGGHCQEKKIEALTHLRDLAVRYDARVVVSDMFAHGWDGDDQYPIPPEALALCDMAYIAYKDSVGPGAVDSTELPVIQLKEICNWSEFYEIREIQSVF